MNVIRQRPETVQTLVPPVSRNRAMWIFGLAGLLCVLVTAGLLYMKAKTDSAPTTVGPAPIVAAVTAQRVEFAPVQSRVTSSGSVAPRHGVDIGSEVSGLSITEVNVDEGDQVKKGQVLARMNSSILESQLSSQEALLLARKANVAKAKQPNRPEDIAGLRAAVSQAEAGVTQAQASLGRAQLNSANLITTSKRYEMLGREGAISQQDALDKSTAAKMATSDVDAAKQQLEAAKFSAQQARDRYQMAFSGGRKEDVAISLSDLAQTEAAIQQTRAQLAQTVVRAPSDGLITKRNADVGEIAMTGQALFSMTSDSRLELQAQVQEVDLPAVRAGMNVLITPASSELKPFIASVREVSPRVDVRTRLGIAYIALPLDCGLREGMYATAAISTGTHQSIVVPTKSIMTIEGGKYVFVLLGDKVSQRSVQTGAVEGDTTEILSGLQPGVQIVVAGAGFLKDGDRVNVR